MPTIHPRTLIYEHCQHGRVLNTVQHMSTSSAFISPEKRLDDVTVTRSCCREWGPGNAGATLQQKLDYCQRALCGRTNTSISGFPVTVTW